MGNGLVSDNELPAGVTCVLMGRKHRHERRAKALALYRRYRKATGEHPVIRHRFCPLPGGLSDDDTDVVRHNIVGYSMQTPIVVPGGCQRCHGALVRGWYDGEGLTCISCGRAGGDTGRRRPALVQLELAL